MEALRGPVAARNELGVPRARPVSRLGADDEATRRQQGGSKAAAKRPPICQRATQPARLRAHLMLACARPCKRERVLKDLRANCSPGAD